MADVHLAGCDTDRLDGRSWDVCWFCKKGRHEDCMREIPTGADSEGPHDCTFDVRTIQCRCRHEA